jgi:hypothetical protein
MEDKKIIELYFARNESAIAETEKNTVPTAARSHTASSKTALTRRRLQTTHTCAFGTAFRRKSPIRSSHTLGE